MSELTITQIGVLRSCFDGNRSGMGQYQGRGDSGAHDRAAIHFLDAACVDEGSREDAHRRPSTFGPKSTGVFKLRGGDSQSASRDVDGD